MQPLVPTSFNGTCIPIRYPCNPGTTYIDPCSCSRFFQCVNDITGIISQPCPYGTGYNPKTATCITLNSLIQRDLCDQKEPWDRCEDFYGDAVDEDELEYRCTGNSNTQSPQGHAGGDGGGGNRGLIAGVVIAVLIAIVLVALVVIYVRKRGNPIRHLKESKLWRNVTRKNRGGDSGHTLQGTQRVAGALPPFSGEEETYAEIDDAAVYKNPGGKQVGHTKSYSNDNYDTHVQERGSAYDNPAFQRNTPPPSLDPAEFSQAPPPQYSPLGERELDPPPYSALAEDCQGASVYPADNKQAVVGDDGYLLAEPIKQSRPSSDVNDSPYFVLEKGNEL